MAKKVPPPPPPKAVKAQSMDRGESSPMLFDDLGYSRTTMLIEYSCRTKAMLGYLGAKMCVLCLLDNVLPQAAKADPVYSAQLDQMWKAAKDIDSNVPYLEKLGEMGKTALKCCLLYPCFPVPPMMLLMEGFSDFTGKGDVKKRVVIKDNRSGCSKVLGYKKGHYDVFENGVLIGRTRYEKSCCAKKFYRFEDSEGVAVAKYMLKPTFCETYGKCCCCPCCWYLTCCKCQCCRTKPMARILAPTWKSRVEVMAKAGCCKGPKFKIVHDTLFVPGQGTEEDEKELAGLEMGNKVADEAAAEANAEAAGPAASEGSKKYMTSSNEAFAELKGKQKTATIYYKGPGCCKMMKREFKRMVCASAMGDMDVSGGNTKGVPAGYMKSADDVWDVQFGKKFTVSQKIASLLYAVLEFSKLQD